jgi:LPS-assembly lipoprotein
LWRRAFLLLPLSACGFEPLHAPPAPGSGAGPRDPALADRLASVRVALVPERNGQLLRRELQRRFEDTRPGTPARYELRANLVFQPEILGYRRDGAVSRVRFLATANWALVTRDDPPEVVARSAARTLDAYNIPDLQFFAADVSREAMERRLVAELAERVYEGVLVALRARPAAA